MSRMFENGIEDFAALGVWGKVHGLVGSVLGWCVVM